MRGRPFRTIMLGVASALLVACSSSAPPAPAPKGPSIAAVGKISVRIGSAIAADERAILAELNGPARLETAIEGELGKAGTLRPDAGTTLEAEITDFRLRSGATVFFAGIMAGVDTLYVRVLVRDAGGRVVREFTTGDSTSGGFAGLSSSSRFQTMADALAERLRAEM